MGPLQLLGATGRGPPVPRPAPPSAHRGPSPPRARPALQPEVISALGRVRTECAKALKMSFFNTHYTKSLRLEEFEQGQMQVMDHTANYLKDSWVMTLKNCIKSSFKDVGKGWFNLHESNMET